MPPTGNASLVPTTEVAMSDKEGVLRMIASGRWTIYRPGRLPVEITSGELFRVEVAKCLGLELRPGEAPGSYTIAHPHPPQPRYLHGWRVISLDQVEDTTSEIEIGQDPRFGCGMLRAVRVGKPWRHGLPACYVERLDALKGYYYQLSEFSEHSRRVVEPGGAA
jgi:hypothetical protein